MMKHSLHCYSAREMTLEECLPQEADGPQMQALADQELFCFLSQTIPWHFLLALNFPIRQHSMCVHFVDGILTPAHERAACRVAYHPCSLFAPAQDSPPSTEVFQLELGLRLQQHRW